MNTRELAKALSEAHGLSQAQAREILDFAFDKLAGSIARGEEVSLPGFGKFKIRATAAREGRNPRTGQPMPIAASKKVSFTTAKALKERL